MELSVYAASGACEALGSGVKDAPALVLTAASWEGWVGAKRNGWSGAAVDEGFEVGAVGREFLELVGGDDVAEVILIELLSEGGGVLTTELEGEDGTDVTKEPPLGQAGEVGRGVG